MPRFEVNFADPKTFFYPGETVVGNIIVRLDSAIKCKKISLKFKGESYVEWTIGSGESSTTHKNTEEYLKKYLTLLAPLPPDSGITLHPGEFNYPFQFQLPNNLPPSVDAPIETGYVQYYMKIKIDVDSWKSDIEEKIPFKVVAPHLDLNQTRNLLEPATATEEKFLCCLCACCQSGPIRLVGRMQKQAYYLGEQIVFSFEIDNKETDQPLRKIESRLMEQFTLISNLGNTRKSKNVKSSLRLSEGVPPGGEDSWHNVTLGIPTNIMQSFNNCKCIHLEYYFIVNVDIEAAFDPQVKFPITISSGPQMVQPMPANVMPPAPGMMYPPLTTGMQGIPPQQTPHLLQVTLLQQAILRLDTLYQP